MKYFDTKKADTKIPSVSALYLLFNTLSQNRINKIHDKIIRRIILLYKSSP